MKRAILAVFVTLAITEVFCQETNLFAAPGDWSRGFEAVRIGMSAAELSVLRPEAQTTKFDESYIPEEGARKIELERMEHLRDFPEKGVELEVRYEIRERKVKNVRFNWSGQFEAPEELRASFVAFCEENFGAEFLPEVVERKLNDADSHLAPLMCWKIGETSVSASCTPDSAFEQSNYGTLILTAGPDDDTSVCSQASRDRREKGIGDDTICRVFEDARIEIAPIQIGTYRGNKVFGDLASICSSVDGTEVSKWAVAQRALELLEFIRIDLTVSESEVDEAHAERLALVQFDDDAASKVVKLGAAMKEALQQWQASPERDQAIYESLLKPLDVSSATWDSFKKTHATPDALEKMWVPKDEAVARNAGKESIRNELLRKKLAERVGGEAIVPEGAAWDAFLKSSPPNAKSDDLVALKFNFIQQRVSKMIEVWMSKLVLNGDLSITSPEYKTAIETRAREISAKTSPETVE
jgi:hypothetical protein